MSHSLRILLMTGGNGTRLWPKSRQSVPKQFLKFRGQKSLFRQTLDRVAGLVPQSNLYAVSPPEYVSIIKQQAPELSTSQLIVEPTRHSTTASLGFTLLALNKDGLSPGDVIVLLPTDAYISDDELFRRCLWDVIEVAESSNGVVTIGAPPFYPATGYGYIQIGVETLGPGFRVKRFVEKPNIDEAKGYVQDPHYYWNCGIFAWKVSTVWNLIATCAPGFHQRLLAFEHDLESLDETSIAERYRKFPEMTFEYTLVERASEIFVVPAKFDWMDLGTWGTLLEKLGPEVNDTKPVVSIDADGCLVENDRGLVALLGVQDLVVINTEDVVFVYRRDREQDVKRLLDILKQKGYDRYL